MGTRYYMQYAGADNFNVLDLTRRDDSERPIVIAANVTEAKADEIITGLLAGDENAPCMICGAPLNAINVGHDFGCMIEPRYTLDGEPLDWSEFNEINPDLFDEYGEGIAALKPGESMNLGGGASPIFVLAREAE